MNNQKILPALLLINQLTCLSLYICHRTLSSYLYNNIFHSQNLFSSPEHKVLRISC